MCVKRRRFSSTKDRSTLRLRTRHAAGSGAFVDVKVLVTGAAGFIGSHVVEALRARGADIVALARPGGRTPDADVVAEGDYGDASAMAKVFDAHKPAVLIHSA